MKKCIHVVLFLTGMLLFPSLQLSLIQAQLSPNEKVDEIFAAWDGKQTPGAAVAVVRDGAIIYKKGYGMANLEYDIPISPISIFHIASVSKQFTVFSILLLQSEGKVNLDDDIRKYIPEVPDFGPTITLRHLASHTSGLRDQWALLAMAGWRLDDVITKEHVLKLVSKQKDLNFEPGEKYLYCNTGFTLLAEVVSRVSGKTFAEFTEANIFGPLQMNHTLFYDDHEKIVKNRTYSYHLDITGFKKSVLSYAIVGATSLFTTVEDLTLWALNFSEIKIGSAEIVKTMNTPAVLNDGEEFGGALGQFVGNYKGLNEISHGGADAGFRSYFGRFPDQKFSIMVFSNSAVINAEGMAHKIVDIYLKEQLESEVKEEVKKSESTDEKSGIDSKTLESYLGEYEFQPGVIASITEENGQLFAKASGQAIVKLNPITKTEFAVEGDEAKVEFVLNDSKNVELIKLHQGEQIQEARRLMPFDKTTVDLLEFTGRFYSEELATAYDLKIHKGKLVAQHIRLSDIELGPLKKDVFSGDAWFFSQIEFIRENDKTISGCKVSSGRVRNLYFKKLVSRHVLKSDLQNLKELMEK
ncbi:MAG: serine hydrolase [Bacteroides sp.]|nr:serine hydrolase [Bacteroides sp.]